MVSIGKLLSKPIVHYKMEQSLIKRIEIVQIRRQIEVLATFVPNEILNYRHDDLQRSFVSVLLFADVSGFTPLTEKYNKTGKGGIYRLTATLNAYIGAIVEVIHFFGGDILKFSGDAFLALWKVKQGESAFDILHGVVVCALVIQKNLGVFETEVNVLLKVKLAISCGNTTFSIIGSGGSQYYVILGQAIYDVKNAEHVSVSGDVVISPAAWSHMLHDRYDITYAADGNVKVWKTIYKKNEESKRIYYEEKTLEVLDLVEKHLKHRSDIHHKKTFDSTFTMSQITNLFIKSLPKREEIKKAPTHWISEDLRPFIIKPVQDQVDESQPVEYLTEMREITIQFINIVPISYDPSDLAEMCNNSYKIICKVIGEALGVVNKVSLFDKDFMILVLFGLRGIRHEMESQHALRSAYTIQEMITLSVANVQSCSIGLTQGLVYCGVVGHPFRREYTVIGTEVNKAARIMCAYPGKVTCDYKSFKHSKLASFYFKLQNVIKLKGIEDAGSIYEYNETFDDFAGKTEQVFNIFGREKEFNKIRSVIFKDDDSDIRDYNGICFNGPRKIGKTTVLIQAIMHLKKLEDIHTLISIQLNSRSKIPYFCISKIYEKMYNHLGRLNGPNHLLKFLPRHLFNPGHEVNFPKQDVGMFKYNILNVFRRIIDSNYINYGTLIFIDNIEFIDYQSWEIIEIVFNEMAIKLFLTVCLEEAKDSCRTRLESLHGLKIVDLRPIASRHVASLACMFLEVVGIPDHLEHLLINSCEGRPGYIQSSILRLINNGSFQLKLINKSEKDPTRFIFPKNLPNASSEIIPIAEFSERYKHVGQELTLQAISMDLFDSFTPYQQLIIKTASVLGDMFPRFLLIVAMQYPSESQLNKAIKQLFEEEVFECGSRYLYATDIESGKFCCRCNFGDELLDESLPRYAYCTLLHFKNRSIREVAYDLLPGNQKNQLHLLCTEVMEYAKHVCPVCKRQPITQILNICKYQTVMDFCTDPKKPYKRWKLTYGDYGDMKAVIRAAMAGKRIETLPSDIFVRPHHDVLVCKCYDIWIRVLRDLRYHAEQGKHPSKLTYFTMKYGFSLLLVRDYENSIRYFREAVELCLIDAKANDSDPIMANFRRFIMGRTQIGLTRAHLALGQVQAAKNHLAISLRQYHIPSLAMEYHGFNELMNQTFVVNIKQIIAKNYKNTIVRFDCGHTLAYCAKVFALEGNWSMAKFAALNSVQYLKTVNTNIPLLMEVYCNVMELYAVANKQDMLEKLQRYIFHEVTYSYSSPDVNHTTGFIIVMETLLESYFAKGKIRNGIRLGYRLLDICIRLDHFVYDCRLWYHFPILLLMNGRIRDAGDILQILKARMYRMQHLCVCYYHILSMITFLLTGFIVEDVDKIIAFAADLRNRGARSKSIHEFLFILIHLHYLRLGNYSRADEWKTDITWTPNLTRQSLSVQTLIFALECRIIMYIFNYHRKNANITVESKRINKLMIILRDSCKNQFMVYKPMYFYYKGWLLRTHEVKKKSTKFINKMIKESIKSGNVLTECLGTAVLNAWEGGYSIKYERRPSVSYLHADSYTFKELAQFMHVCPIE